MEEEINPETFDENEIGLNEDAIMTEETQTVSYTHLTLPTILLV